MCTPAVTAAQDRAAQDQAQPSSQLVTAKIRLDDLSMIIVPVSINGFGPYDFLLDTGCSKTMIDRKLADQLGLSRVGEKTVVGVLASIKMSVVHVDSISVAGATVGGGELFSSDHSATVTGKVRGVLGEDFLRNFDLLIDYRHQSIRLESPLGSMAQTATGEHLPLQLTAIYHGKPTNNRLVISGRIQELGNATMSLLLDSGANQLTLFQDNLGPGVNVAEPIKAGSFNQWVGSSAVTRRIRSLNLGSNSVTDLTVVALSRRVEVDTDGVIPTSFFHSIFISHLGRFVILNPSFAETTRDGPR
jgi:predicted aspartyl protease